MHDVAHVGVAHIGVVGVGGQWALGLQCVVVACLHLASCDKDKIYSYQNFLSYGVYPDNLLENSCSCSSCLSTARRYRRIRIMIRIPPLYTA